MSTDNNEKMDSVVEKGKEAAEKAAEFAENAAVKIADGVSDAVKSGKETLEEGAAKDTGVKNETLDSIDKAANSALDAIGGFLGQAGNAIKNAAENVTKKDLDKDGKIGEEPKS